MAVIVDREPRTTKDVWQVARWAFVWLLRQAQAECADDSSTRPIFEKAIALDGLHLHLLEPDDARATRRVLLKVASTAAAGGLPAVEVDGRVLDDASQQEFRTAANELISMLHCRDVDSGVVTC
jgi:hypothetical protein